MSQIVSFLVHVKVKTFVWRSNFLNTKLSGVSLIYVHIEVFSDHVKVKIFFGEGINFKDMCTAAQFITHGRRLCIPDLKNVR